MWTLVKNTRASTALEVLGKFLLLLSIAWQVTAVAKAEALKAQNEANMARLYAQGLSPHSSEARRGERSIDTAQLLQEVQLISHQIGEVNAPLRNGVFLMFLVGSVLVLVGTWAQRVEKG